MTGYDLNLIVQQKIEHIRAELPNRAYRAANAMRNAELDVLTKQAGHGGRVYRVPGAKRYYRASAPGEVPAIRTDTFRPSWEPRAKSVGDVHTSSIESTYKVGKYVLGDILENGTPGGKMAPRPHQDKILEAALPEVLRIYNRRYF